MIKLNAELTITSDDTEGIVLFTNNRNRFVEMIVFFNLSDLYVMSSRYRLSLCYRYDPQSYYELARHTASWGGDKLHAELLFPERLQEYGSLSNTILINGNKITSRVCQCLELAKRIRYYMGLE